MLPTTTESNKSVLSNPVWGTEGVSSKDLVIANINIAQATSDMCKEGSAKPGEIVHSQGKKVLAAKGASIEILPILCLPSWLVSRILPGGPNQKQRLEFLRKEILTPENDSDQWKREEFENSEPIVKDKCLSFLVLFPSELNSFPLFMDFKKTNRNGGKLLSTIIQENGFKGLPAPARVVEVSTTLKSYQGNTWFAYQLKAGRAATGEELTACKKWFDIFQAKAATVVEFTQDDDPGIL